jgi:hypothetical protein
MSFSTTSDGSEAPWALLESLNPRFNSVRLTRKSQVIGRNRHCQIVFSHTTTISAIHTCIRKATTNVSEGVLGFVDDLSSNGTYIITDGCHRMIGKGNTAPLMQGDIVSLVVIPRLQANGTYSHKDPKMASDFVAFRVSSYTANQTNMMTTPQLHYAQIESPTTGAKRRCLALDTVVDLQRLPSNTEGKLPYDPNTDFPIQGQASGLANAAEHASESGKGIHTSAEQSSAHVNDADRIADETSAPASSQDPLAEILQEKPNELFTDDYERGSLLGRGAFARVFSARHKRTGLEVAVKQIDKRAWKMRTGRCQPERLLDEVRLQVLTC